MSNVAGAHAQAKNAAFKRQAASDVQGIRDNLQDIGNSVGDMATRQYERAHDTVSDALQETGSAIQRNPLVAVAVGLGLGFLFGLVSGGRSKPASRRS
jgi:ElaB/YqjD/DUF883 family membrane-anchored ribosome-binding protein